MIRVRGDKIKEPHYNLILPLSLSSSFQVLFLVEFPPESVVNADRLHITTHET
jgi:hypothetical protein